jgi:hypothetical protein
MLHSELLPAQLLLLLLPLPLQELLLHCCQAPKDAA